MKIYNNVILANARILFSQHKKIPAYAGMTCFLILLCIHPAFAQEKLKTPKYEPDYCQFSAKFPNEPYITKRCDGDDKSTCYDLISYTKVFDDVQTSVRVEIICNPSTPAMYKEFDEKVMKSTVHAMTKGSVIEAYEVNSRQEENYRQAGLLGKGKKGLEDTIYIAQLWIADKSIMSVEAELIGKQSEESDKVFADILRNIGFTKDINKDEKQEVIETNDENNKEEKPPSKTND